MFLRGTGFTPNGEVVFTRDGKRIGDPIMADPGGELQPHADAARARPTASSS